MQPLVGAPFQDRFFAAHPSLRSLMDLFDLTPGAYFYAKDADSRFVRLNPANASLYDEASEEPLLGKSDRDLHPPSLAEAYIAEDQRVIRAKKPLLNQTWLVPFLNGPLRWFVSSKTPLFSAEGECVGVAGVMHPIATPEDQLSRFQRVAPAVRMIEQRFREPVLLADLGECCQISPTHVHRLFRKLLKLSPSDYVHSLRLQEARTRLATTSESISSIAVGVGFFDQSHFTKRFRLATGMTPAAYRAAYGVVKD
ncbi:MAG: helix-turn-helix domain-containing protein [Lacipirellulaceae bacterium]